MRQEPAAGGTRPRWLWPGECWCCAARGRISPPSARSSCSTASHADLAAFAQRELVLAQSVRERLGPAAGAAVAASPPLSAVFPDAESGAHPDQFGQTRTVTALARLLDACGGAGRPALVIFDDCQWAEQNAVRVLSEWSENTATRFTLAVAAYRSEEVPAGSPLRSLPSVRSVQVGPMDEAQIRELAGSMAGPIPAEATQTVVRMAAGNPFMAQAVLRGMVETGALLPDDDGWRIDADALRAVELSRRAALFLMRRLDLLSTPGQRLVAAAAVVGKEFDVRRAVELSGLESDDAATGADECRTRRIIWVDEADDRAWFGHDKLREAVLARLADDERADLHLGAARLLQAEESPSPFEVAFHLDAAGHAPEALGPALVAAEQARSRHALDAAEFYYGIARRAAPGGDTQVRVAEGLGEVLALAGRYDEAEAELGDAARLTDDPRRRAALEGKLGEVAFRRGDQAQAATRLETALRQLGRRVPRHRLEYSVGTVWELMVQAAHTVAPRHCVGRRRRSETEEERLAMRFYSRLAYAYWFRSGKVLCGRAHLRGLNLAERFAPVPGASPGLLGARPRDDA